MGPFGLVDVPLAPCKSLALVKGSAESCCADNVIQLMYKPQGKHDTMQLSAAT